MHPQNEQYIDEDYLQWVREQPSIASGRFDAWSMELGEGRNDPNHLWNAGKIGKRNDYLAVPVTREEHTIYHTAGHDTFLDIFKIIDSYELCLIRLLTKYLGEIHGHKS